MILTGGLDGRPYIQANVMARIAQAQGVPASSIFLETQANDTIHNACYSARIMKAHGWHSAEIISVPPICPAQGLIFTRLPTRLAHPPRPRPRGRRRRIPAARRGLEFLKTMRYCSTPAGPKAARPETCPRLPVRSLTFTPLALSLFGAVL